MALRKVPFPSSVCEADKYEPLHCVVKREAFNSTREPQMIVFVFDGLEKDLVLPGLHGKGKRCQGGSQICECGGGTLENYSLLRHCFSYSLGRYVAIQPRTSQAFLHAKLQVEKILHQKGETSHGSNATTKLDSVERSTGKVS